MLSASWMKSDGKVRCNRRESLQLFCGWEHGQESRTGYNDVDINIHIKEYKLLDNFFVAWYLNLLKQ